MAFTSVPTVATGDVWSAANHNQYIKDNFAAIWAGTTAGDIEYYTSSSAKTRLAINPTAATFLRSTGSAPEWGSLIYYRQGGASNNWRTNGTTTYNPSRALFQVGARAVSIASGTGTVTVNYPAIFNFIPLIWATVEGSGHKYICQYSDVTTSKVDFYFLQMDGADTETIQISWMAIGE